MIALNTVEQEVSSTGPPHGDGFRRRGGRSEERGRNQHEGPLQSQDDWSSGFAGADFSGFELPPLQASPSRLSCLPNGTLVLDGEQSRTVVRPRKTRVRRSHGAGVSRDAVQLRAMGAKPLAAFDRASDRIRLAITSFFVVMAGVLYLTPLPGPLLSPVVTSMATPPESGYVRVGERQLTDLPVDWMVRVDETLLVRGDDSWVSLPVEDKVEVLREIMAVAGAPAEILMVNDQSELLAEVYGNQYHLYRK